MCSTISWATTLFTHRATARRESDATDTGAGRTWIVYLSHTGNTKAVGVHSGENRGDLAALELQKPYPEDYRAAVDQVSEENERGHLPPLKTKGPMKLSTF
jgi:flavodoxin